MAKLHLIGHEICPYAQRAAIVLLEKNEIYDPIADFGIFSATPKVRAWRQALMLRPSVRGAVDSDYPEKLRRFLKGRGSEMSRRIGG